MVLIIIRSWLWWWWASPVFPVLSLVMITSVLIIVEMNEMIYIKVTSDRLCLCSAYPSLRYQSRHGSQHSPSLAEIQQIQQNKDTNIPYLIYDISRRNIFKWKFLFKVGMAPYFSNLASRHHCSCRKKSKVMLKIQK